MWPWTRTRYSIAKQFTRRPGPGLIERGPFSGELFRETVLIPLLREGKKVEIDLDGTVGYGASFLREAFGGLVRKERLSEDQFWKLFRIKADSDRSYIEMIRMYVEEAISENF